MCYSPQLSQGKAFDTTTVVLSQKNKTRKRIAKTNCHRYAAPSLHLHQKPKIDVKY